MAGGMFGEGLWQNAYMGEKLGGPRRSVFKLHGAGDLYVTSKGRRNQKMGRYLGMGVPFSEAKAQYMAEITVEGAQLAQAIGSTVEQMVAEGRLDGATVPLMLAMIDIVCHDAPVAFPWDDFFAGEV